MKKDQEKSQGSTKKFIIEVAIGLTISFICFICGLLWTHINPFDRPDVDDDPSSSPSIEPSPVNSEMSILESTPSLVPMPTPTPSTQASERNPTSPITPAQTPTIAPTPTPAPTPAPAPTKNPDDDPVFIGNANTGGGVNIDDGSGEFEPQAPKRYDYPEQDVITGTIPEP